MLIVYLLYRDRVLQHFLRHMRLDENCVFFAKIKGFGLSIRRTIIDKRVPVDFRLKSIVHLRTFYALGGNLTRCKKQDCLGNIMKPCTEESFFYRVHKLFMQLADHRIPKNIVITYHSMIDNSCYLFGK